MVSFLLLNPFVCDTQGPLMGPSFCISLFFLYSTRYPYEFGVHGLRVMCHDGLDNAYWRKAGYQAGKTECPDTNSP